MTEKKRFSYHNLSELIDAFHVIHADIPVAEDAAILGSPVRFGRLTVPNRMVVQPMEGCDAAPDGRPTELTARRYNRFAAGGAGLLWWEATAVVSDGRANPRQLWLHAGSIEAFADMLAGANRAAESAVGRRPVNVLQLTHSGRYSRPVDRPAPVIAHHSAVLDPCHKLPADYPLVSDDELDALQDAYVTTAKLAADAGFDGVDIKSCHRYLLSELLASFTREDSRYGGDYENRTRMLRETVRRVIEAVGGRIEVTCRLNAYDAIAYPYGWGVRHDDPDVPDLSEPLRLLDDLVALGVGGVNISIGNPYFNPHVNRPADRMIAGMADPPESPLAGTARIVGIVRNLQKQRPNLPLVGAGYSWLRQFFPHVGAGVVRDGWAAMVGLGRGALAYPDFARDILEKGAMDPAKVCITCSGCTQLMRDHQVSGCVVRDAKTYGPILRQGRAAAGG